MRWPRQVSLPDHSLIGRCGRRQLPPTQRWISGMNFRSCQRSSFHLKTERLFQEYIARIRLLLGVLGNCYSGSLRHWLVIRYLSYISTKLILSLSEESGKLYTGSLISYVIVPLWKTQLINSTYVTRSVSNCGKQPGEISVIF